MNDKQDTPDPLPLQEPPHGGSWLRKADGSLELLHSTQPAEGRRAPEAPAATDTEQE